jgi:DNA-binding beta-propeller fold protein YncE
VADNEGGDVVPINVTTGTAGQPIAIPPQAGGTTTSIVFTPDGTTAYVGTVGGQVTPIDVSKGVAEAPIPGSYSSMAITPGGRTLYVFGAGHEVTRVNTATNTLDAPLTTSAANDADELLMSPDGKSLYLLNGAGVLTVISTETGAVGKPISTSSGDYPRNMAITPDGKTLYITEHKDLVPFNTESQAVGKPIRLSDFPEFYGGLVIAGTAPALPLSHELRNTSRCACARVSSADPAAWSGTCVSSSLTVGSSKGRGLSTRPSALAETRAPKSWS